MTPNPQSPAYALFAQSWLPFPHSKSRTGVIRVNDGVSGPSFDLSCLRIKISRQYEHCTGGVWPANFERLRETKDLSAPCMRNFAHRMLQNKRRRIRYNDHPRRSPLAWSCRKVSRSSSKSSRS